MGRKEKIAQVLDFICCSGFPCLSLCCWGSLLVAGFSNGQIRLYSVETGQKTVEIAAHGRCITALDVARDSGLVSRDCTEAVE